jgi:hypothetical protein
MLMTPYYVEQLAHGKKYQDLVMWSLGKDPGITIRLYTSREFQMVVGESVEGYEIKYDGRRDSPWNATRNDYVEVEERSHPSYPFVPSGILRKDNSVWYCLGDYNRIFFFDKKELVTFFEQTHPHVITIPQGTSRGFLLTPDLHRQFVKQTHPIHVPKSMQAEFVVKKPVFGSAYEMPKGDPGDAGLPISEFSGLSRVVQKDMAAGPEPVTKTVMINDPVLEDFFKR